jgi:nucleotide-binding universal stress UspA family protein
LIKNILVAVDGSQSATKALDFAMDLAEKYEAHIRILNIAETPVIATIPQEPTFYGTENTVVIMKDLRRFHEEILSKAEAYAKTAKPNVQVSSKLREGDVASEIVGEAKEGAFDVVVVGHVGAGRVKELFGLGGISEKVAHLAHCPVVIVR